MHTFGELLKSFRTRAGLSQTALGDAIGRSRNTIGNWEAGRTLPNLSDRADLLRLVEALDLTEREMDQLLFAAQLPVEYQTEDEELRAGLRVESLVAERVQADILIVKQVETPSQPRYTDEDVQRYLQATIDTNDTLDLGGMGGPVAKLPLESLYVALKADPSSAAERRANERQLFDALEQELGQSDLDPHGRVRVLRRAVALGDPIALSLVMRDRAGGASTYLGRQATQIDVGELVARERWAVLLGDPGAGKTTVVRWLALQFARALMAGENLVRIRAEHVKAGEVEQGAPKWVDLGPAQLPVPLRLADYLHARWQNGHDTALTLFDYLGRQPWQRRPLHPDPTVAQAIVHDAVNRGEALLLLDGLDEITDPTRRRVVVAAIEHFLKNHVRDPKSGFCPVDEHFTPRPYGEEQTQAIGAGNRVLITSRVVGYVAAPVAHAIPHYTVEEMQPVAIGRFCRAFTRAVFDIRSKGNPAQEAEELRAALLDSERPGLAEIAANPLLLTILAGLYYTVEGRLPDRRIALYDEVVQAFLRQRPEAVKREWETAGLGEAAFLYLMGLVAFRLHANPAHPNALAAEDILLEWLEEGLEEYEGKSVPRHADQAELLLQTARNVSGFLLARGDGVYGFIHRTFQEYFAARYLARHKDVADCLLARLGEPAWRVPLLLTVARVGQRYPKRLLKLLQQILQAPDPTRGFIPYGELFLAACVPELSVNPPTAIIEGIVEGLIEAYADRAWPPAERTRTAGPLRREIETTLTALHEAPGALAVAGKALQSPDPRRRLAIVELILQTNWTAPGLVAPLLITAREYAEPAASVREALRRCHVAHPDAFTDRLLPIRMLWRDTVQFNNHWTGRLWREILTALYLVPGDGDETNPPRVEAVFCDSELTPLLLEAWRNGWSDEKLL